MKAPPSFYNVLVIGDTCTDIYHYCKHTRINPECESAPLISVVRSEEKAGMAGNVVQCISKLGFSVDLLAHDNSEITKTRFIDIKTHRQLFRVDNDQILSPIAVDNIDITNYSAIVISDYNKGSVTDSLIIDIMLKYNRPIFLDTKKKDLLRYNNCTIKINEIEASEAYYNINNTIITLGSKGAKFRNREYPAYSVNAIDTCGAGDAFLAGMLYGAFCGSSQDIVKYGIVNAGISTQHIGVYAPTLNELKEGIERYDSQVW